MPIEVVSLIIAIPCLIVVTEQLITVLIELEELL